MRRFIALLSVVLLTLIGCSRELPPLQFALDKYDVEIPAEGGAVEVRVMSNQPWELTGYTTWCEPSIKSGVGRAEGEVVTFTAESASYDRSVTYRFCAGGESFELRVTQQKTQSLSATGQTLYWADAAGGDITIEFSSNIVCEVIVDAEWLSAEPLAPGQRSAKLTAETNATSITREARVEIRSTEDQELSIELTVRQPSTANVIYYTSTDGMIVEPNADAFNAAIANNLIYDGCGIMELTAPPQLLEPNLFVGCAANLGIYVPADSVAAYKSAAGWKTLADKIYALD